MSTVPQANPTSTAAFVIEAGNERREFKTIGGVNEYLRVLYSDYKAHSTTAREKVLVLGQALTQIRGLYPHGTWERHLRAMGMHLATCRYAIAEWANVQNPKPNTNSCAGSPHNCKGTDSNQPNTVPNAGRDDLAQGSETPNTVPVAERAPFPCHTCGKPLEADQVKGDICSACADRGPKDDPEDDPGLDDDSWVDDGDDAGVGIAGDDEDLDLEDDDFEDSPIDEFAGQPELNKPKTIGEFHKVVLDTLGLAKPEEPAKRMAKPEQLTFESVYAEAANRMTSCIQGVRAALESGTLSDGARARMEAAFKNISSEIESAMRECGLTAPNERGA